MRIFRFSRRKTLRVAHENIASATRVLNLIQQRLQAGTASRSTRHNRKAWSTRNGRFVPPLEQTLRLNRVTLAVLMGRSPEGVKIRGGTLRSITYPDRAGTRDCHRNCSAQRPDIREAEANLAAANANVVNAPCATSAEHPADR